jgi:hypothetical protein
MAALQHVTAVTIAANQPCSRHLVVSFAPYSPRFGSRRARGDEAISYIAADFRTQAILWNCPGAFAVTL